MRDETTGSGGDQWLNSAPTNGDAKKFLPGGAGGINVSPDGVKVFASQANGESEDFRKSSTDGVMKLSMEARSIGMSFLDAEAFGLKHAAGLETLSMFTTDVGKGLMALGTGAASIAITYINGDTTSAATLSEVERAFDVSGGKGMFNAPGGPAGESQAATPGNRLDSGSAGRDDHANHTAYDPHAARTISMGDDSYTIPADGANDLERLNPRDLDELREKFGDDLAKTAD